MSLVIELASLSFAFSMNQDDNNEHPLVPRQTVEEEIRTLQRAGEQGCRDIGHHLRRMLNPQDTQDLETTEQLILACQMTILEFDDHINWLRDLLRQNPGELIPCPQERAAGGDEVPQEFESLGTTSL